MVVLRRMVDAIDRLNFFVGKAAAWLIFLAVVVSASNAISRKAFRLSSNAMLELQWYLFGTVVMLVAAWVLQRNEHVRIDILSNKLSARTRHWIDIACHVLMLAPFAALMTWLSYPYLHRSFVRGEVSLSAGGLIIWPMRAVIVIGFALLLLQVIAIVVRKILDGPPPRDEPPAPDVWDTLR
ncbi:MAG: TRAP transporter small permease subunit [Dehalococcoidia bacterium]